MKSLLLLIILCTPSLVFSQQSSKAELIDEFEHFNCEDFKARVDNFYIHLNDNSSAKGYLVISGDKTQMKRKLVAELLLESAVVARVYDRSRVQIVKGPESGKVNIKLWLVPAGVEKPDFHEGKWELTFQKNDKPFMLESGMDDICPPAPFDALAKELLDENPEGRIYVVVYGRTPSERSRELTVARKKLASIASNRLRYFIRTSDAGYSDYYFAVGRKKRTVFKR